MSNYVGVKSHSVVPSPLRLRDESALLHWHQEEPFLSASIYLQWCVARLAKECNTTVLLDGQGADELLAGYQFYFPQRQLDLLDKRKYALAVRETKKFRRRLERASLEYENSNRRFNSTVGYSVDELKSLSRSLPTVFHYPYDKGVAPAIPGGRLRRTLSEAVLYNSLPMLLRYADRNSMAFSREARLPYLDHKLVEFCISLPDDLYVRHGWQKWILRQSIGARIPAKIRWRADKVGYASPLDNWLRLELKDFAQERLFDPQLREMPNYNLNTLQNLWIDHQEQRANNSWAIWRWISLSEWLSLKKTGWWRAGVAGAV